jgi:hypothetical protein
VRYSLDKRLEECLANIIIPPEIVDIIRVQDIKFFTLCIIDDLFIISFDGIVPVNVFVRVDGCQERSPLAQHVRLLPIRLPEDIGCGVM